MKISPDREFVEPIERICGLDTVRFELKAVGYRRSNTMQHLSAYEKVQLARHPQRPYFLDYVGASLYGFH